jgi:hypothetical protein
MSNSESIGAIIENGPEDWQIIQQNNGSAELDLSGRYVNAMEGEVEVRLVSQDTGVPVARELDWHSATTNQDNTWKAALNIPSGGLYRLETRYNPTENKTEEWSARGDMRHFVGVGDLWVIAGQSNSAGFGRGPYNDPPELGVHLFRSNEEWALAAHPINDSTNAKHPSARESFNPYHSPYLHFGRILKQSLGYPIGLVPTAVAASPLKLWNPTESDEAILAENMIHCIKQVSGRVRGILWYQGESDCRDEEETETYFERFRDALAAWREAIGDPELPIITGQLNRVYDPMPNETEERWSKVREAQRRAARELSNIAIVPSFDSPLCDRIHNSPAGNMRIGERMARAALGMVYGKPVDYLPPDVVEATSERDGKEVHLQFAPVRSRFESADLSAVPFKVLDEEGAVQIERVAYLQGGRAALILERQLKGAARVHGAYGTDPAPVPMDFERLMPMLGFYGVEVVAHQMP